MTICTYSKCGVFIFLFLLNLSVSGQVNYSQIKGRWAVEKLEEITPGPKTSEVKKRLEGLCLTFHEDQLVISKTNASCDSVIKAGSYSLTNDTLRIGNDQATILVLTQSRLKIQIPRQGILHLTRM